MTPPKNEGPFWAAAREIGLGKIMGWATAGAVGLVSLGTMIGAKTAIETVKAVESVNVAQSDTLKSHEARIRSNSAGLDSLRALELPNLAEEMRVVALQVCLMRVEMRGQRPDVCAGLR